MSNGAQWAYISRQLAETRPRGCGLLTGFLLFAFTQDISAMLMYEVMFNLAFIDEDLTLLQLVCQIPSEFIVLGNWFK